MSPMRSFVRASASTVIGVVPGASPAYLRRRVTAAGRRSAAIWSSSSDCKPRKMVSGTSK